MPRVGLRWSTSGRGLGASSSMHRHRESNPYTGGVLEKYEYGWLYYDAKFTPSGVPEIDNRPYELGFLAETKHTRIAVVGGMVLEMLNRLGAGGWFVEPAAWQREAYIHDALVAKAREQLPELEIGCIRYNTQSRMRRRIE